MGTTLTEVLTQTGTTPSTEPANAFQLDREATLTTTRATLKTLGAAMAADSRFLSKTKASEVDLKAEGSTQLSEILDNDEFTIRMKAPPEAPDGFYEVKRKYDNSERADESSEMYQLNPADKLAAVREALDDFMKPGYQFLAGKLPLGKAAEAKTTLAAIATKTGDQSGFAILMTGELMQQE